ncbi:MAG TPA: methyltransferase domain-containing protein [Pyrinomonadaceae bacterium]
MPTAKPQQRATYDRVAAHYDRAIGPLERRFLSRLRAETLAALPAGGRLLEIGAGTGLNFPYYPQAARGVATELSREMLRRAQAKSRPANVHLAQNRAEQIPFADASFDAACATLLFCSVVSPAAAFAELRRVVKPGGIIALLEHVRPHGALGWLFDLLNLLTVPLFDDHFNRRTAETARRAGLHIRRLESRAFGIINIICCENRASQRTLSDTEREQLLKDTYC